MKTNHSFRWKLLAWVAPPALFPLVVAQTYSMVKQGGSFFPTENFWWAAIALLVGVSLAVLVKLGRERRIWLIVAYVVLATIVLLVEQGLLSCRYGDCI